MTPEPRALTIAEFAARHGIARSRVYVELSSGRLAGYKLGKRRMISIAAADLWQSEREHDNTPKRAAAPPDDAPSRRRPAASDHHPHAHAR